LFQDEFVVEHAFDESLLVRITAGGGKITAAEKHRGRCCICKTRLSGEWLRRSLAERFPQHDIQLRFQSFAHATQ